MRKLLAILVLFGYLGGNTLLCELAKVPLLVQHYMDHTSNDPGLSFSDFLNMHYTGKDIKDGDYDTDMKLPYKSHDHSVNSYVFYAPLHQVYRGLSVAPRIVFTKETPEYSYIYSSLLGQSIWQPPKIA
ncbi:MAG: hypothetical protein ACOVRN_06605 [Flavobacterium sp.]